MHTSTAEQQKLGWLYCEKVSAWKNLAARKIAVEYLHFFGGDFASPQLAKYSMAAIDDIQQALNIVRKHTQDADWRTRLQALELMLSASQSVVARARQLAQPKTKTRTVTVPKPKTVRRYVDVPKPQAAAKQATQPKPTQPIKPRPPLSNQQPS